MSTSQSTVGDSQAVNTPQPPQTPVQRPVAIEVGEEVMTNGNYSMSINRSREIISEIEAITKRRTITYFAAAIDNPASYITDSDATQIEDLLRIKSDLPGLDLILNSYGGFAVAAERIAKVCKNYVQRNRTKEFRLIVPKQAKSAATMVALGADKIILCDNAELGPIDPQLILTDINGRTTSKPAFHITKAINELMAKEDGTDPNKNTKYIIFLQQYNYDSYIVASNELSLSKSIAEKIYKEKKLNYPSLTAKAFDIFTDPEKTFSHGRPIGIDDLEENELYKEKIIVDLRSYFSKKISGIKIDKISSLIWELLIKRDALLNDNGNAIVKVIEDNSFLFASTNLDWQPPQPLQQNQPVQQNPVPENP